MKRRTSLVVLLLSTLYSIAQQHAIVVNSGSDTATIFNPQTNMIISKIPTKHQPEDVRVSPTGKWAYILNMGSSDLPGNSVDVYDLEKYVLKSTISLGKYTRPHWSKISGDGKTLWVACANQNAIVEIDLTGEKVKKVWDTKQPGSYNFTVSKDEKKIYTANFDTSTVSIIDRTTGLVKIVSIGGKPIGADTSPDGSEIWISSNDINQISVFNTNNDQPVKTFSTTGQLPTRLVFTTDGSYVVVTHAGSKDLCVFNARSKKLEWKVSLNGDFPKAVTVSPDNKFALVSFAGGNEVTTIDLKKKAVIKKLRTGESPAGLAYIPVAKR